MQYTIRNIPDPLDAALRRSAREQGKSLNDVAIEALAAVPASVSPDAATATSATWREPGIKIPPSTAPWKSRTR